MARRLTLLAGLSSTQDEGRNRLRFAARGLVASAAAVVLIGAATVPALAAAPNEDSVIANVSVSSVITLNLGQGDFALNGIPGATVAGPSAVTGVVTTNNAAGYSVGVVAAASALQPATGGNTDSIPITALKVTNAAGTFIALDTVTPVVTTTKTSRSATDGDSFSDDYKVTIPDVNSDTYSVTLNYTATALA